MSRVGKVRFGRKMKFRPSDILNTQKFAWFQKLLMGSVWKKSCLGRFGYTQILNCRVRVSQVLKKVWFMRVISGSGMPGPITNWNLPWKWINVPARLFGTQRTTHLKWLSCVESVQKCAPYQGWMFVQTQPRRSIKGAAKSGIRTEQRRLNSMDLKVWN